MTYKFLYLTSLVCCDVLYNCDLMILSLRTRGPRGYQFTVISQYTTWSQISRSLRGFASYSSVISIPYAGNFEKSVWINYYISVSIVRCVMCLTNELMMLH